MAAYLLQVLNSLSFSALLFVVASGFTLVFGLLRVVNLAHGAFYLLGGYVGLAAITWTGSFFVGLAVALCVACVWWVRRRLP